MKLAKLSMPRRPVRGSRDVLGLRKRIADSHAIRRDADGELLREEIVGDPHLVAIGVGAEREERRVLRLPAEAADAPLAGRDVGHERRPAADAVAIAIEGILEREQCASSGIASTRPAPKSGIGTRRAMIVASGGMSGWHAVPRNREQMEERFAGWIERLELARGVDAPARISAIIAAAADGRHAVAHGAARAVERRTQPFLGGFDLEKVVEAQAELLELDRASCRAADRRARTRATARRVSAAQHSDRADADEARRPGRRAR